MVRRILELLETPLSEEALSQALGIPREALKPTLQLLESRGYLERLEACTACERCAIRGLCQGQPQAIYRRQLRVGTITNHFDGE
ncbi:MAG: hypothetical protein ACUVS9_04340 [Thermaceae bacterium]